MRPIVGITSYAEEVTWGGWVEPAALVPLAYVRAIEKAGGRPLVVPPSEETIEETLAVLDGIFSRAVPTSTRSSTAPSCTPRRPGSRGT